jgi:FAD/FMN-containing dehydrogenase
MFKLRQLIMTGGISFLSNRYGWAADSITAFEVVLPDASIKTVSQKSDPDLFWALRGGGNNFGVVTAFHSELIKRKPEVWRGTRGYTLDKMDALLEAQYKFITEVQANDPDAVAFFPYVYNAPYDLTMTLPTMIHGSHSDNATWPEAFAAFEKIEGLRDTTETVVKPMSAVTDDLMLMNPHGMRTIYKTITYRSDPAVDKQIIGTYLEQLEKVKKIEGIMPCIVFHPTPAGHTGPMSKNGGNPLGLAGERPLTIMQTSWMWKNKEDDSLNFEINKILFEKATKAAEDAGKLVPYIYQNYAWQDQDVFAGYGKENLARLRAIQSRIDPEGVFAGGDEGLSKGYFKVNVRGAAGKQAEHVIDEL